MELDAWRVRFAALRQQILEDDEEDELNAAAMLVGMEFEPGPIPRGIHGGSRPGRGANLAREREEGHRRMFADYFAENPIYGPEVFRRRYRMQQSLFVSIMEAVCKYDPYFVQKRDATGALGLSPHQKCTAALRMLAYGVAADNTDEYCRIAESTAMEALKRFVFAIRQIFQVITCVNLLGQILRNNFVLMLSVDLLACLHPSIVCTIYGKIVP